MGRTVFHATDKNDSGQRMVTTVCFKRVVYYKTFPAGDPAVSCVGCRAILAEREKEKERAKKSVVASNA